jgi:hypothetical protein
VQEVFSLLGAGTTVYDAEHFEPGKKALDEIIRYMSRSDIFVLFSPKTAGKATG